MPITSTGFLYSGLVNAGEVLCCDLIGSHHALLAQIAPQTAIRPLRIQLLSHVEQHATGRARRLDQREMWALPVPPQCQPGTGLLQRDCTLAPMLAGILSIPTEHIPAATTANRRSPFAVLHPLQILPYHLGAVVRFHHSPRGVPSGIPPGGRLLRRGVEVRR